MKPKNYFFLLSIIIMFTACKKTALTKPVNFTSTAYANLGTFDLTGKPDYLASPDTISPYMLSFISSTLPDGKDLTISHPEFFNSSAIADVTIAQPSDVYITFVKEGCRYTNSLAFYTYPTGQSPTSAKDIKLITYIFPNSGNYTPLDPGNKVKLGKFDIGTSIGFVLMQNAWDTTAKLLDNNAVHFCTNDALNPEVDPNLKKHAVLINYTPEKKLLIGFEDTNRTDPQCDHDFNDVVIYCTVTPR
ncbi:MAG: DUF4114 domain-containing protein [Ginsengibacter sp.]